MLLLKNRKFYKSSIKIKTKMDLKYICESSDPGLTRVNYKGLCVDVYDGGDKFAGVAFPGWNVLPPKKKVLTANHAPLSDRLEETNYLSNSMCEIARELQGRIAVPYNPGVSFSHPEHEWRRNSLADAIKQYAVGNEFMTKILGVQDYTVYTHSLSTLAQMIDLAKGDEGQVQGPGKHIMIAPFTSARDVFDHLPNPNFLGIPWEFLFNKLQNLPVPSPLSPLSSAKMHVDEDLAHNSHYGLGTWMSTKSVQNLLDVDSADILENANTNTSDITMILTARDRVWSFSEELKRANLASKKFPHLQVFAFDKPHNIFPYKDCQKKLIKASQ